MKPNDKLIRLDFLIATFKQYVLAYPECYKEQLAKLQQQRADIVNKIGRKK